MRKPVLEQLGTCSYQRTLGAPESPLQSASEERNRAAHVPACSNSRFTLTIEALPVRPGEAPPIIRLRQFLKIGLRGLRLRTVEVREEPRVLPKPGDAVKAHDETLSTRNVELGATNVSGETRESHAKRENHQGET